MVVVNLAAGQGSRIRSEISRVLCCVGREALAPTRSLDPSKIIVVVDHGDDEVEKATGKLKSAARIAGQSEQLGAGHTIRQGLPLLERVEGKMIVFYGDPTGAETLRPGDVIILDNLSSHKSPGAAETLCSVGAWFLFLPPYGPDLNSIEMAFSKLKSLIRKVAARTYDQLWTAVGQVCDLFSDEECYNFFKVAGCETD